MRREEFGRLLESLATLSARQRAEIIGTLQDQPRAESLAARVANGRLPDRPACPRCQSARVVKWGRKDELQRYRCHGCGRTFNSLTATPLARLKIRHAWGGYAEALVDGLSVRKAGRKLMIHFTTAFRWRHRWLTHLRDLKDTEFKGFVEADETFFRYSMKGSRAWRTGTPSGLPIPRAPRQRGGAALLPGLSREQVPVLVVRDRDGATTDAVLSKVDRASVTAVLGPLLRPGETILCTDAAGVYRAFAGAAGIYHRPVNLAAGKRVAGVVFHVQNVNAYQSRLKDWMRRFRGVATKYLPNYLGWRRTLDRRNGEIPPDQILALAIG